MTTVLWSVCLLASFGTFAAVNAKCVKIKFPTAKSIVGGVLSVTMSDNQTETVPFHLDTSACREKPRTFTIIVSKREEKSMLFQDVCKLRKVESGDAVSFGTLCRIEGEGRYSLSKHVDKSDGTLWRWRAVYEQTTLDTTVQFIVTYPPRITELSLSGGAVVPPGASVDVVCRYEKGVPNVPPQLTEAQGRELAATVSAREVRHTMRDVRCKDTGNVSCQVPGTSEIWSTMLLVRCPPHFQRDEEHPKPFMVEPDKPAELVFQVRTHTANLTACLLTHWPLLPDANPTDCLSRIKLTGSPPDMTLTLHDPVVTSAQLGDWSLKVSNDGGSHDVTFTIHFPASYFTTTAAPDTTPTTAAWLDETSPSIIATDTTALTSSTATVTTIGVFFLSEPEHYDEEKGSDGDKEDHVPASSSSLLLPPLSSMWLMLHCLAAIVLTHG